jgi:NADH:ubiquinone oxidoreductase subunit E
VEDALRRHLNIPHHSDTDHERQFTIEQVACLGTCTLAPVVKVGEATFGHTSAERVPEAMREFLELQKEAKTIQSTETVHTHKHDGGVAEIHVGLGSCCMAKGSDKLFHALNESAAACGGSVVVKRVGCVGMCHRTPMIEVAEAGKSGTFYADLTAAQARALVQRHFKPRGFVQRASRIWTRVLDGLLLDDNPEEQSVQRFSMSKRDPNVRAFLDKQVHIATEHFGKLDPLDLDEYLASGGFEALKKCLGVNEPLTAALSPSEGERENHPQVSEKARVGVSTEDSERSKDERKLSPLPGGEGQPDGVKLDDVTATFTDGVLEVSVPLPVKAEPVVRKVAVEEPARAKTAA